MKKYRMVEVVGDGTYGTVWKGIYLETGEKVAIKKLKSKIKTWQECIELKEVKALSKLKSHQNIVKLKEVIRETNSEVFFVFEYADTNLYEYVESIKRKGYSVPELKIKEIVFQIAMGLSYIHSNGYFHRDMKPENILLMLNVSQNEGISVKIADFGLAKEIPSYYNNNGPLTDYVCTRWYRPPECILKSTNYSSAMDIWALGCIMCELYMLKPIFPGNSEFDQLTRVMNVLGAPKFNDWPEGYKLIQKLGMKFSSSPGIQLSSIMSNTSAHAINLLNDLFNWDPLMRPNCAKILSHPYFDDVRSNNSNGIVGNKTIDHYKKYSSIVNANVNTNTNTENNYSSIFNNAINGNVNDDYLNNFNYKVYRNSNNYIPEINNNYTGNSIYNQNNVLISIRERDKSKLSNLAENDLRFNKYNKINKMMNTNSGTNNYGYHDTTKNDYYSNNTNNFYYDVGANNGNTVSGNKHSFNSNDMGSTFSKKYMFKSDVENGIPVNTNAYSKGSLFTFPQIFI